MQYFDPSKSSPAIMYSGVGVELLAGLMADVQSFIYDLKGYCRDSSNLTSM